MLMSITNMEKSNQTRESKSERRVAEVQEGVLTQTMKNQSNLKGTQLQAFRPPATRFVNLSELSGHKQGQTRTNCHVAQTSLPLLKSTNSSGEPGQELIQTSGSHQLVGGSGEKVE